MSDFITYGGDKFFYDKETDSYLYHIANDFYSLLVYSHNGDDYNYMFDYTINYEYLKKGIQYLVYDTDGTYSARFDETVYEKTYCKIYVNACIYIYFRTFSLRENFLT